MKELNLGQYVEKYRLARKGQDEIVLLEGIHSFKHALRFGAEILEIIYVNDEQLKDFKSNVLSEDERKYILKNGTEVEEEFFDKLLPYKVRSKIVALAKKPCRDKDSVDKNKPIIFLENPRNPENIGMVIRVAAAYGAGAVVISGKISPLTASVIRSGAGLVFAVPVFLISDFSELNSFGERILISADPEGMSLKKIKLAKNSIIIFGTEREGISEELKAMSKITVKVDMKKNVSSLNLATSVSALLFSADFE